MKISTHKKGKIEENKIEKSENKGKHEKWVYVLELSKSLRVFRIKLRSTTMILDHFWHTCRS